MKIQDYLFEALAEDTDLNSFDCGDGDINEFLKSDALPYQRDRLAYTYLFLKRDDKSIVAFFSISNNCLKDEKEITSAKQAMGRTHRNVSTPFHENVEEYPGVLIGRLGVHKDFQRNGLGNQIMDFIKGWVYIDHKPAFRLLMLDAYNRPNTMRFYTKNGFIPLLENDTKDDTRLMYFDILRLFDN